MLNDTPFAAPDLIELLQVRSVGQLRVHWR